jgi:hypothetical protein
LFYNFCHKNLHIFALPSSAVLKPAQAGLVFQFIEEEDPEEVAKVSETKKTRTDVFIDSDSDDDSDDMLYTDESSSESNESDNDPNYGSGRRDANWSHRSNKTKKKKLKKMRKMKLLSRSV